MSYSKLVLPLALVASLGVARGVRAQPPAAEVAPDTSDEAASAQDSESSAGDAQQPDQEQVSALLDDEARTRFRLGTTLYRQGRFADAAREFRAAYEVSHRPELLYNLYLVERDAGNTQEAADALRTYLSDASEIPDRGLMEGRLAALDRQLAATAATNGTADDTTDDATDDAADDAADDATDETDADETAGPPVSPRSRVLPLTLMIAGGAVVVLGTAFAFAAKGKYNTLDSDCTDGVCLDASSQDDIDALRRNTGLADLSFILGGASLITGVVLFLLRRDSSEEPAVSAGCGPSGCGLSMQGSF